MAFSPNLYSHSRRNGSVSSTSNLVPFQNQASISASGVRASSSSQSTRSSTATSINPLTSSHMESTVTRLLVATKQLLESLTDWSQARIDEGGVSDIYVRLGNEFNAASLAFSKEGIDMSDLNSVPDDLRACLEAALSEEATPATLDQHLPQIRQIVVHLLQGLKTKQAKWRAAKRQQELELAHAHTPAPARPGPARDYPDRPGHPSIRSGPRTLNAVRSRDDLLRVSVGSSSNDYHRTHGSRVASPGPAHPFSRSTPGFDPAHPHKSADPARRKDSSDLPPNSDPSTGNSSKLRLSPVTRAVRTVNDLSDRLMGTKGSSPPAPPPPPPPMTGQHGYPSSPVDPPYDIPIPPIPPSPHTESTNQAQASSLEALRKTDLLQRRASKRFSTYTYNKITATASPHKRGPDGQAAVGLGVSVPALPRSPNGLVHLGVRDESEPARDDAGRELLRGPSPSRPSTNEGRPPDNSSDSTPQSTSSVLGGPDFSEQAKISAIAEESETSIHIKTGTPDRKARSSDLLSTPPPVHRGHSGGGPPAAAQPAGHPTVFLQLGRDVKKAKLDGPPTIASLRVLFMDRFQYNPGMDDFPAIYLRDPQSGVQYQLEDLSEVKERVVLSLNIDALDQVKTHIDSGLSGLAREIKELKSTITTLRRQSVPPTSGGARLGEHSASQAASPAGPSDAGARPGLLRVETGPAETRAAKEAASPVQPSSAASASDQRLQQLSGTCKTQYTEVQALRRELGILRQLYGTFADETRSMLGGLRGQTEMVRQAAASRVSASRTFIDSGKAKLETRSQDLVTKIESLQDTVEDLKQDVTNRKMRPKPSTMETIAESLSAVGKDLSELTEHISTIKPGWKRSWEEELQNIVDEQQLLNYQEELVKDLKEDLAAVSSLYGHVRDYLDVRKTTKVKPQFVPPGGFGGALHASPREGLETVLMQVKAVEPDGATRLKAIEAAERQRERNAREAGREDEFAQELAGFVGGRKLKMTGGTEETERLRKIRSEQTIKAMVAGNGTTTGGGGDGEVRTCENGHKVVNGENEKKDQG